MTKKELIDRCYERLCAMPDDFAEDHDLLVSIYNECRRETLACGYSERAFSDVWYNAMLWYKAVCRLNCGTKVS